MLPEITKKHLRSGAKIDVVMSVWTAKWRVFDSLALASGRPIIP
jgi:hypothetical protein